MKKMLCTLVCVTVLTQLSMAQPTWLVGLSGSVNSAGFTYQNNYGQSKMDYDGVKISPFFSVFGGADFDKKNQLLLEVAFASYGAKYKDKVGNDEYEKDVKLNYISIPLLYRYVVGGDKPGKTKFFVTAGPQLNLLSSATLEHQINGMPATFTEFVDNPANTEATAIVDANTKMGTVQPNDKDLYNTTSFDGVIGLGALFTLGENLKLSAELRGGYGFTDINAEDWRTPGFEDKAVVPYKASHIYYGGLRIGLQYSFGGGKEVKK